MLLLTFAIGNMNGGCLVLASELLWHQQTRWDPALVAVGMQNKDDVFGAFLTYTISISKSSFLWKMENMLEIGFSKHCFSFSIDNRLVLVVFSTVVCPKRKTATAQERKFWKASSLLAQYKLICNCTMKGKRQLL